MSRPSRRSVPSRTPERPLADWRAGGRLKRVLPARLSFLIVGAVTLAPVRTAKAQAPLATLTPSSSEALTWAGHGTVLAGNAVIGGLTGGVLQKLKGGSFADGFARGALGGSVIYAGKRVAAQRFWAAGLLGREINAVGASVVRNAADGEATFGRLFLPLGPLPLRAMLAIRNGVRVQPQIDLAGAGLVVWGLLGSDLTLNLGRSVSSGAPVFEARDRWLSDADHGVRGLAVARSVFLGDPHLIVGPEVSTDDVLAHERVHVLQQDFVLTAWGDPFAGLALRRFGAGRRIDRYVTLDALGWVVGAVSHLTYGTDRQERFPTELEARFLTGH